MEWRERFEQYYDERGPDECWVWDGGLAGGNGGEYGSFKVDGKTVYAHRAMAKLEIDAGLDLWPGKHSKFQVLHHCDNPICVNPDHLYVGTTSDNQSDRAARTGEWGGFVSAECTCPASDCEMHGDRNGENNPNAALTMEQAEEIRERYETEDISYRDLAGDYPCSAGTCRRIVIGEGYVSDSTH